MLYEIREKIDVPSGCAPVAILTNLFMENGCCPGRPVVVTGNRVTFSRSVNYSAQCACGLWCTTGCSTPEAAVSEYKRMTAKAKKEREARGGRKYV